MIDPKDLRPLKPGEMVIGGTFYKLESNNTYSTCQIFKDELKDPRKAEIIKLETKKLLDEKKLFVRLNKPFKSFS